MENINRDQTVFSTILFDLGNTLMYFDGSWHDVLHHGCGILARELKNNGLQIEEETFKEEFYNTLQKDEQSREITLTETPTETLLMAFLTEKGQTPADENILRSSLDAMYAFTQQHWHLDTDTHSTLHTLKEMGFKLGVISNARDEKDAQTLIERENLRQYFSLVLISSAMGVRKPNPKIFIRALQHWDIPAEQTLMVGDNLKADIYGAQQIGMKGIWLNKHAGQTPQNRNLQELVHPFLTIDSLSELPVKLAEAQWEG